MKKLKIINKLKKLKKKAKNDFENTEFEETDFQPYDDLDESIDSSVEKINKETKPKTKKIRISKKKARKAGVVTLAGIVIMYCISKLFGNKTNQEEDAIYKWGQTNNLETIELKNGLEIENGTDVIQRIYGDDITTMLLTEQGIQDITKYNLDDLAIQFYKNGKVDANEAAVEMHSMDGKEKLYRKLLPEKTELQIYPEPPQDGMLHVRDLKTGEEGLVEDLFIEVDGDIEFTVQKDEESLLHIVGINGRAPIRSTDYNYQDKNLKNENVIGYEGNSNRMDFTIATKTKEDSEYYYLFNYTDRELYLSSEEVADLYKLTHDGIEETKETHILLQDKNENEKVEDNHFIFGVISNEALVGESFFSKGKNIESGSLYFEFAGEKRMAISSDGLANISSSDMEKLDINYVQTGTAYGYGKSISIKDVDGNDQEGKKILDYSTVSTLPGKSIEKDGVTLVPIFDERTRTGGFLKTSDIPDLRYKQFEISEDSKIYLIEATEDTPIRTSTQTRNGYSDNIMATILKGHNCLVEDTDGVYKVMDPRFPEWYGGLVIDETIAEKYKITSKGIEEQEEKKDEQGKDISLREDFIKGIAIANKNIAETKRESNGTNSRGNNDSKARG